MNSSNYKEMWIDQNDLTLYESQLKEAGDLISVAAYLGVACISQDTDNSLMMQTQSIRDLCSREFPEGCKIIWVSDHGASGTLPYWRPGFDSGTFRTGLTSLIQLVERGLVQHVCVYNASRLTRSVRLLLDLKQKFENYGVRLLSATEAGSSDDVFRNSSGFNGWRPQDRRGVRRCQRVGIEPVPQQAKIVQQIWEWFAAGLSRAEIADNLTKMGVPSPGGNSKWTSRGVRDLLRNPVHAGLIRVKGKYVRGAHFDDRIIDESLFHAAEEQFRDRKSKGADP